MLDGEPSQFGVVAEPELLPLLELGKDEVLFKFLVIILDELADESGRLVEDLRRDFFLVTKPAQALFVAVDVVVRDLLSSAGNNEATIVVALFPSVDAVTLWPRHSIAVCATPGDSCA